MANCAVWATTIACSACMSCFMSSTCFRSSSIRETSREFVASLLWCLDNTAISVSLRPCLWDIVLANMAHEATYNHLLFKLSLELVNLDGEARVRCLSSASSATMASTCVCSAATSSMLLVPGCKGTTACYWQPAMTTATLVVQLSVVLAGLQWCATYNHSQDAEALPWLFEGQTNKCQTSTAATRHQPVRSQPSLGLTSTLAPRTPSM